MKFSSLRRAGALLLALALSCSLLTLPAAADDIPATSVTLNRTSLSLEIGASGTLTATLEPEDSTDTVSWSSDNSNVQLTPSGNSATVNVSLSAEAGETATITAAASSGPSAACQVTVTRSNVPVTGITLDKTTLTMQTGDANQTLNATVTPANATDKSVEWLYNPRGIVEIGDDGTVTALAAGTTSVRAQSVSNSTVRSNPCTITVTLRPEPVTGIALQDKDGGSLSANGVSIPLGTTFDLKAVLSPSDTTESELTWESTNRGRIRIERNQNDGSRATISLSSSAQEGDEATIIVRSTVRPNVSAVCAVRVTAAPPPKVSDVHITTPNSDAYRYVDVGATLPLKAVVSPSDATDDITWTSSNPSVATVDRYSGVVTGVAPGEAKITASAGTESDERDIEVSGLLLSYIKKSTSGVQGDTISLSEDSVVDIYQYRDISVTCTPYGNARNRTINWESSNNTVAQVISGRVTGHYPGEAVISAAAAGTNCLSKFKVKVSEDVADAIIVDMGSSPSYPFSNIMSQLNNRSQSKAGDALDNVYSLKVSTENGVLYYGYTSPESPGHGVGGTERYYYRPASNQGQMALRDVSFVPLPGFDGIAVVDYSAVSTNGVTFSGTIRIEADSNGDVSYSTAVDHPLSFAAEHFSAVCKSRTGQAISYVTFVQPSANRGTLYYNYSPTGQFSPKVDSSTRYYASSNPSINNLTFVPAEGFAGDVGITYRCTDSSGATYTGTVTITVSGAGGSQTGDVEYSTGRNQRQDLSASDFNDACRRAVGGSLDYIRFNDLPRSSTGTLYLNYTSSSSTKVASDRNYYRNSTPRISNITFVPASNFSGTVTIPFTAVNTSGSSFSGNLVIHVDDGEGTVYYSTPRNQAVDFDAADFNAASRRVNGAALNYIRFTGLPGSSTGTLYYGYTSSSSTGSRVSTGTNYRRSGSPALSSITFVPATNYSGTVTIPFTAYDDNDDRFDGTVTIAVGNGVGRTVSYSTVTNSSVRFDRADFNNACRSATGDPLDYVRFDLPASRYGTLYHQYNSSSRTGNNVGSSTNYYYSGSGSRLINDVSFAAASASGTASFGYTGYSTQGDSFSGTVEVQISGSSTVSSTIYYTGSSTPVFFQASDFQNACQAALGNPLSYVQFNTIPTVGFLSRNYSGPARTGTGVTAAAHYGVQELGQISYLPRAEYQGTIIIPFTAYDTQGGSHAGTVEIQLSNAYCYASFNDTASGWDWAKPSIEFLRQSGIANGYGNNTYRPAQPITRGEFTLMICRAFQFPTTGSSGFPDVPANSSYAGAVASARSLGIVQGNNGLFHPDQPITRQSAMTMICRAMNAAGQVVPTADASLLSSYVDGGQVSAFARSSVASLVQMGAVRGNSARRLNPGEAISRAEMAVILHRVLAQ